LYFLIIIFSKKKSSIQQGIDDNNYMDEHSIEGFPKVLTEITSLKNLFVYLILYICFNFVKKIINF